MYERYGKGWRKEQHSSEYSSLFPIRIDIKCFLENLKTQFFLQRKSIHNFFLLSSYHIKIFYILNKFIFVFYFLLKVAVLNTPTKLYYACSLCRPIRNHDFPAFLSKTEFSILTTPKRTKLIFKNYFSPIINLQCIINTKIIYTKCEKLKKSYESCSRRGADKTARPIV